MSSHVLIVAGGRGRRAGERVPKQFLPLQGVPVLMRTVQVFQRAMPRISCVLVLPGDYVSYWQKLCETYRFEYAHQVVPGGETRFQSVRAGLGAVGDRGYVSVHDGVRPLLSAALVLRSFAEARAYGHAIAAVQVDDTIRELRAKGTTVQRDRRKYFLVQTPQTFRIKLLKNAYEVQETAGMFTDEASVLEHAGHEIHMIAGERTNIKLTYAEDFAWATQIIRSQAAGQDQYSSSLKKKSSLEG